MSDKIIEELLYLPLDLPNPPLDEVEALTKIPYDKLYRDEYRTCWLMPLYIDPKSDSDYSWSPFAEYCPKIREWVENYIFPITGDTRIVVIVTPSATRNAPHIDCSSDKFDTLQHKFRYVLQGNIDDLMFLDDSGNNKNPVSIDKPFVMSGKWPHEMTNTFPETKYTLAVGAPWEAEHTYEVYKELIDRSYELYKEFYMSCDDMRVLENYNNLFESSDKTVKDKKDTYYNSSS